MNLQKRLWQRWNSLSITTKFTLASGMLLVLIILVAITGYVALTTVRRQTEAAIVTSMEVQRLVLEMNANLQQARRLERDFFLRWPTIGFEAAQETYATGNDEKIDEVVSLSAQLKELISRPDVSEALRESDVNLNFYLSAADRYAATFDEAVDLVAQLAEADTGAQARLAQVSGQIQEAVGQADDPGLIVLYREMQSFEKDYLVTRQRSAMQSAFNVTRPFAEAIEVSTGLQADQQAEALSLIEEYRTVSDEVFQLDVEIRSKFSEFDLQADAVDPISEELIALATDEVQLARERISSASRLATSLLIGAVLTAVALAGFIAWIQNNSITRNVVKLTGVVRELQEGNLKARADIDSLDEVGQLASGFNSMADRLNALIDNLEQRVAERTAELGQANEEITALNQMLQEENLRMGAELEVTKQLQRMLLPTKAELAAVEGLDIAGYMEPADEVGGDYYDVLQYDGQVKIGMGDVTGHGLESGVVMLMTQMGIRTLLTNNETDITHYLTILNRTVFDNIQRMQADKSLTLILLDYTPSTNGRSGQVRFTGQHEELIVVRQGGQVELIDTLDLGFPIGLDDDIADFVAEQAIQLESGDGLVLYTDGITEAENEAGEQYELDRLCNIISQEWIKPAEAVKTAIIDDVMAHIGTQTVYDDITLLVVKQQ